jgi:hypothetical protein
MGEQKKFLLFASIVPHRLLELFVKRRLQRPIFPRENKTNVEAVAEAVSEGNANPSVPKFKISLYIANV